MRAEYRIITDEWLGFKVQWRRWWWPFWTTPVENTHLTVYAAEQWAIRFASGKIVRKLGRLP